MRVYAYGDTDIDALNRLHDNHSIAPETLELLGTVEADIDTELEMQDGVVFFAKLVTLN